MNKESACNICGRVVEECDPEETKALFLITKIEKLKNIYDDKLRGNVFSQNPSFGAAKFKLKVLLFSQFPEILETVGYRLVMSNHNTLGPRSHTIVCTGQQVARPSE